MDGCEGHQHADIARCSKAIPGLLKKKTHG